MKLRLSARAYTKMLLHASKYPHKAINGVLLGDESIHGGEIYAVEAVPLFHICLGLAPMLELALAQVRICIDIRTCSELGTKVHVLTSSLFLVEWSLFELEKERKTLINVLSTPFAFLCIRFLSIRFLSMWSE